MSLRRQFALRFLFLFSSRRLLFSFLWRLLLSFFFFDRPAFFPFEWGRVTFHTMSLVTVDIYVTTHFVEQKKRASTTFSFWAFKFLFLYHMFLLPPLTGCKLCCLFINFLTLHFLCLFLTRASYTLPRSKGIQDPTNKRTSDHESSVGDVL